MTRLPHERPPACGLNDRLQMPAAFHIKDDRRARIASEDILGQQHQLPVGPDDPAARVHHAEAVAVAVKGKADIGALGLDFVNQGPQIFRLTRVRVMIGKAPVNIAIQLYHLMPQHAEQLRGDHARGPVAAIDHNLHLQGVAERGRNIVGDTAQVAGGNISLLRLALVFFRRQ